MVKSTVVKHTCLYIGKQVVSRIAQHFLHLLRAAKKKELENESMKWFGANDCILLSNEIHHISGVAESHFLGLGCALK